MGAQRFCCLCCNRICVTKHTPTCFLLLSHTHMHRLVLLHCHLLSNQSYHILPSTSTWALLPRPLLVQRCTAISILLLPPCNQPRFLCTSALLGVRSEAACVHYTARMLRPMADNSGGALGGTARITWHSCQQAQNMRQLRAGGAAALRWQAVACEPVLAHSSAPIVPSGCTSAVPAVCGTRVALSGPLLEAC